MERVSTYLLLVIAVFVLCSCAEVANAAQEQFFKDVEAGNYNRVVDALKQSNPNSLLVPRESDGNTPLHIASKIGDSEIVQALLDNGANVDAQNVKGETALHYAIMNYFPHVVKKLLAHNPNLNLAADEIGSPLMTAVKYEHKDLLQLLKQFRISQFHRSKSPGKGNEF